MVRGGRWKGGSGRGFKLNYRPLRRRQWHPTPVLLPGKSHEQKSLVGYSPWGCKESDTAEQTHMHTCREDPLEKGMATHFSILAWRIPWTEEPGELQSIKSQSQTHLKRLSVHAHIFTKNVISQPHKVRETCQKHSSAFLGHPQA